MNLSEFLKYENQVGSGGEAKILIQGGKVKVNGDIETRRGRKLVIGDKITINGNTLKVDKV